MDGRATGDAVAVAGCPGVMVLARGSFRWAGQVEAESSWAEARMLASAAPEVKRSWAAQAEHLLSIKIPAWAVPLVAVTRSATIPGVAFQRIPLIFARPVWSVYELPREFRRQTPRRIRVRQAESDGSLGNGSSFEPVTSTRKPSSAREPAAMAVLSPS